MKDDNLKDRGYVGMLECHTLPHRTTGGCVVKGLVTELHLETSVPPQCPGRQSQSSRKSYVPLQDFLQCICLDYFSFFFCFLFAFTSSPTSIYVYIYITFPLSLVTSERWGEWDSMPWPGYAFLLPLEVDCQLHNYPSSHIFPIYTDSETWLFAASWLTFHVVVTSLMLIRTAAQGLISLAGPPCSPPALFVSLVTGVVDVK